MFSGEDSRRPSRSEYRGAIDEGHVRGGLGREVGLIGAVRGLRQNSRRGGSNQDRNRKNANAENVSQTEEAAHY